MRTPASYGNCAHLPHMATAHACLTWQVRYAMLGQLKSPANDLADVVKMHFKMRKGPILEQAISAISRRHLGDISVISRLRLGNHPSAECRLVRASRRYLGDISAISR